MPKPPKKRRKPRYYLTLTESNPTWVYRTYGRRSLSSLVDKLLTEHRRAVETARNLKDTV